MIWSALSFRGRKLGCAAPLELTAELLAAIDADQARQAAKANEP